MAIISVDFYGTLNQNADFWQEFMKYLILEGHKIYVISGPWPKELSGKLEYGGYKRRIHWNAVYSVLDHLSRSGREVWLDEEHDTWYSEEAPWWFAKAQICKKLGCQIHFDSDKRFAPAFSSIATRFVNTTNEEDKAGINVWFKKLKLANTYEDWGDEYSWMGQHFVPM